MRVLSGLSGGTVSTRVGCTSCGTVTVRKILDLGWQPLAENDSHAGRYPLELFRCTSCDMIQLSCVPPKEEVFAIEHPYAMGNSKERRRNAAELATIAARHATETRFLPSLPSLIVDIGANDGTFLDAVNAAYPGLFTLVGVEPTDQCKKIAYSSYQEFFDLGTAAAIRQDHGDAAVITANNVLAHVPDPHEFLDGVKYLLDNEGVFITENHDWNSISRGLQIDTVYHEHLRYFTIASLSRLLADHDLTVTDVQKIPAHGGSFRVTAMREPGNLQKRASSARDALDAIVSHADGPIYGIGATTRATPLIHYMDLQDRLECVCEISSSEKIGHRIPGTEIPIVDEKNLLLAQPPYAMLLSWHIKDDLIPKLRQMGYKGKFIIPLPVPEIIDE